MPVHDIEHEIHASREPELPPTGSLFETFANRVLRRADQVISNQECPFGPPSDNERNFLILLRKHQGARRAVPLGHFGERLHLTPREVKEIVQVLRVKFGVQIGSSRAGDSGYFLIESQQEAIDSTAPMLNQAVTMLQAVRRVRGEAQTTAQLLEQISLDLMPKGGA